ncbi:helix-turn-helix domain-containing protein [Lentibacillus saliphilus]|uniref:helix-turn-helix domain-containing protein n=1 Tax=Lentibacillus saliphilus TaxID=2737028 RepID=UPI001C2F831D|nr:helix-turn-helix domain-containing protein [Lentibacillus saliphilus]
MTCSVAMREHRSTSAIFNIMTGKKSIQTVQDVHIYQLGTFYGVYKELQKYAFDQTVTTMMNNQWLRQIDAHTMTPTHLGEKWLQQTSLNLQHFNGLAYSNVEPVFSSRLLLLIQTLTNTAQGHYSFIPVEDDRYITQWVKSVFKQINKPHQALKAIYDELYDILNTLTELEASLFVDRLTGYQHYGMSTPQLAHKYHLDIHTVKLLLKKVHHQIMRQVSEGHHYPTLSMIRADLQQSNMITQSAKQTYALLKKQYTLEQIALIRQLKLNTIYDHLVEIVYVDANMSLEPYVSNQTEQEIIEAIYETQSFRLKEIKQRVHSDVSYFQIRLVLAALQRTGDINGVL